MECKMPSSAVRTFTDPDHYATAIRQGTSEVVLTARGHFDANLTRIDLHSLWMQRFSETVPRIKHTTGWGGRAIIAFPTQPGLRQSWNGEDLQPSQVIRFMPGSSYYQRSTGASAYGSMSMPLADMASQGAAITGRELSSPHDTRILTPTPLAMTRLQRLHAAAGYLAETAPEIIASPDAARGLEQALIEAMVGCIANEYTGGDRASQRRHERIMRRFHSLMDEQPDHPLYLLEVCKAIGVSERTLRMCCQEQLGMSPKQFLIRRRMNMVRRDLTRASFTVTTVTAIATQYGFWDFGRFAGTYKSLFGELPSAVLARAPE
jgi:AraC-like DNA-binding protein